MVGRKIYNEISTINMWENLEQWVPSDTNSQCHWDGICHERFQRGTDTWNLSKYSNDKPKKDTSVYIFRAIEIANAEVETQYTWGTASSSLFEKFSILYKK